MDVSENSRRGFLRLLGASSVGSAALTTGCLGGDADDVPEPVNLSGGKFDDEGGMEIGRHGGPNGQVFYADNSPREHDNPAWFHTLVFGLFPYHFDRLDRGWEAEVVYVTDYSSVDWSVQERDRGPTMPSPTAPETFGDATEMTYVAESEVMGGMGPALHPFSDDEEARSFVDEHGGTTVGYDGVTREYVSTLRRTAPGSGGGGTEM